MKIRFRQSGGVAGVAKVAEVESAKMPGAEAERLRSLVDDALAEPDPDPDPGMPDEEQFYVEIETEHRRRTILVRRSAVPLPLRPLIDYLQQRAEYEKR